MSSYFHFNAHQQQPTSATPGVVGHSHHGGRNRRQQRPPSVSQNSHKQFRQARKEMADNLNLNAFRTKFEAGRSFDLEDDLEFCPSLLTESDLVSIHSSSSERSSLASNSPESSPSQPLQVAPAFSLNSNSPAFVPPTFQNKQSSLKLHQPAATRTRNAIPIINPATGISMSSPPPSVSPGARMPLPRRW
jgi:hypothetical protein